MSTPKMTEDQLLTGLTEAMTYSGWLWRHARRDDLALVMGSQGLPDLIAVHHKRRMALAWELKTEAGVLTIDQSRWLTAFREVRYVNANVVRPNEYDMALAIILGHTRDEAPTALPHCVIGDCQDAPVRMLDRNRGLCMRHDA